MSEHTVVDLAGGLRGVVRRPPQPHLAKATPSGRRLPGLRATQ
jgi:hypothetical protein